MKPKNNTEYLLKTFCRVQKSTVATTTDLDQRILNDAMKAQEQTKNQPAINQPQIWRIIMQNRIIKYAAAAAIIIAIVTAVNMFGVSPDGAKVAWADLADRIQNFQTVVYEIKSESGATKGISYYSDQFGIRTDTLDVNEVHSSEFYLTEGYESIVLYHYLNKYLRIEMDEESIQKEMQKADPRQWIYDFMKEDYRSLGSSTINNNDVEGIEIEGHHLKGVLYENCRIRLWVDVKDQLPVRLEQEATALSEKYKSITIYDNFQWGAALDFSTFSPEITRYTEYSMPDIPAASLESALEGLRLFAQKADGKFPSSLARLTVMLEYQVTNDNVDEFALIMPLCLFYGNLVKNDKDVAYNGNLVTLGEGDKVLWRWKITEDQYQIVFGDLRTEIVGAVRLAQLEGK